MKSRKLSKIFLSLLLVFTLVIAAGCEDENKNTTNDNNKGDVVDKKDVQINTSAKKANVIKKLKRFDNKLKNKKRLIIESNLKG